MNPLRIYVVTVILIFGAIYLFDTTISDFVLKIGDMGITFETTFSDKNKTVNLAL
ncbi:hypothetical protein AB3N59_04745 [Leptospira sp. WS92.C1]